MDEIRELKPQDFPPLLKEIADPPEKLYIRGVLPDVEKYKFLCVVGPRKYSLYGKEVCQKLISKLAGQPIVIVSGLALGTDALAHEAALEAGLVTIAVPGSGLNWNVLHPKTNHNLARRILKQGGAHLCDYEKDFRATIWSFAKRNRIMAGLSHATLVIEAAEKSGTLITARLAMEYNRDVMVVPGPITSHNSFGSNALIKDGATPVMSSKNILDVLGIKPQEIKDNFQTSSDIQLSKEERKVIELLSVEPLAKDELLRNLDLPTNQANILISSMELKGLIKETMGKVSLI